MTNTDNSNIITLNIRFDDNEKVGRKTDETFVIEISNEKKVDALRPIIKKRLAPLFDNIPSTKIRLFSDYPPGTTRTMEPKDLISTYFSDNPNYDDHHISVKAKE